MTADQQEIRERCRHPAGRFVHFPREATEQSVAARFEGQARRQPDRLAVKARGSQLTYAELNAAANRVARAVLDSPDPGGGPVALLMETGVSLVAAMLGVLKAGAAFVPMDPTLPRARLAHMLQGTRPRTRLTTTLGFMACTALGQPRHTLVNVDGLLDGAPAPDPGRTIAPDSLAYVLYTSGSTGQPKGVMQTHRNQLHHVMAHTNGCHFGPDDRVGVQQPLTFTAGIWNMFCALLNGGAAILFDLRREGPSRRWPRSGRRSSAATGSACTTGSWSWAAIPSRRDRSLPASSTSSTWRCQRTRSWPLPPWPAWPASSRNGWPGRPARVRRNGGCYQANDPERQVNQLARQRAARPRRAGAGGHAGESPGVPPALRIAESEPVRGPAHG